MPADHAGLLAWADSWPPWEIDGRPLPHPVVVMGSFANGNVLLCPVTTKAGLCRISIALTAQDYPSAFKPGGILSAPSWLCVRDRDGSCALVGDWQAQAVTVVGTRRIVLSDLCRLDSAEFARLRSAFQSARR